MDETRLISQYGDVTLLQVVLNCWRARAEALTEVGEHGQAEFYTDISNALVTLMGIRSRL